MGRRFGPDSFVGDVLGYPIEGRILGLNPIGRVRRVNHPWALWKMKRQVSPNLAFNRSGHLPRRGRSYRTHDVLVQPEAKSDKAKELRLQRDVPDE